MSVWALYNGIVKNCIEVGKHRLEIGGAFACLYRKRVREMYFPKENRVKLKGKELRELNAAIFTRDGYCYILCGRYVSPGEKFHHDPNGNGKSDEIHKGVVLCGDCHWKRHFTDQCMILKRRILKYLQDHYPDKKILH